MSERFLTREPFVSILHIIDTIVDPIDGFYVLHVPIEGDTIDENTMCSVILSYHTEDEIFMSLFAAEHGLIPYCEVSLAQHIIQAAKQEKPNVSLPEIVKAIDYYLEHDAFMRFI